jgi:phage-related tail fiber protein
LRLSKTGALPTGLNNTSDYFVEVIDANTFYLTTSIFGVATRLTTTGTQSGVHSYLQSLYGLGDGISTFNCPDGRGKFYRSLDLGAGIDTGRGLGTVQKGTLTVIDTVSVGSTEGAWSVTCSIANPSLSLAQALGGMDNYTTTDYANLQVNGAAASGNVALPSNGGGNSWTGVMRPSNIAVPYIIKY